MAYLCAVAVDLEGHDELSVAETGTLALWVLAMIYRWPLTSRGVERCLVCVTFGYARRAVLKLRAKSVKGRDDG